MRLDGDALDALDALENLLNAESADVVNDVLDDACKAWCDGAREGEEKRTQRLRKNCEKIKEKLEVESDDEALRTTRACETVVRMSVWALGASGGENASMGFERAVTHEKLRALLVERALERRGKWREKITSARAMPVEVLKDFDWCVRGTTGGAGAATGNEKKKTKGSNGPRGPRKNSNDLDPSLRRTSILDQARAASTRASQRARCRVFA